MSDVDIFLSDTPAKTEYQKIAEQMKASHEDGLDWSQIHFVSSNDLELANMADCLAKEGVPFVVQSPHVLDRATYINSLSETVKEAVSTFETFKKSLEKLEKHLNFKPSHGIEEQARELKAMRQTQR